MESALVLNIIVIIAVGIHVKRDKQCDVINRGCPKDIRRLAYGSAEIRGNK